MTFKRNDENWKNIGLLYECVFNGEWDKFQDLMNQGFWDERLLRGLSFDDSLDENTDDTDESEEIQPYTPIHHITIALDILLHWDDWNEKTMPIIQRKAENNDKFMTFFRDHCHVPMDYNELLWFDTYSYSSPEDPFENVFVESREDLLKHGNRDIDIDLYWAVYTLNFKWAEELLQKGANPNARVCDGYNVYDHIEWMEIGPSVEDDPYLINPDRHYTFDIDESFGFFCYLIRYALYAKMQMLVERYDKS